MSEAERAVAAARDEGRAEARAEAAQALAAEVFRTAATGKLADPDAHLEVIDLAKLVSDGQPNRRKINALVDRLAAQVPAPPQLPGRVPAGPRQPAAEDDWMRAQLR